MGPVQPPQRKGRMPHYSRDKLVEPQDEFDELECKGVFCRPEDIGVSVEYLSPSFLVKKPVVTDLLQLSLMWVGIANLNRPSCPTLIRFCALLRNGNLK